MSESVPPDAADLVGNEPPAPRAAPIRIGPVGRAPTERWLQVNGLPAAVAGHGRPGAVLGRPLTLLTCGAALLGAAIGLVAIADLTLSIAVLGAAAIVAVIGSYAMMALGIGELAVFTVGAFARTARRTGAGVTWAMPLLLVAVLFLFLTGGTWMSIGRLTGLPMLLTLTLIGALALIVLLRPGVVDWRRHRIQPDAAWFRRMVPRHLMPGGPIRYADPAPGFGERINLRALSVLGRALVAMLVGLLVFGFFLIFGVLTVDATVTQNWSGAVPQIWWQVNVANHTYLLTAELFRVAGFLGVFVALYVIVTCAADRELAAAVDADTTAHLHRVLAVRALYRAQLEPSSAVVAADDEPAVGPLTW